LTFSTLTNASLCLPNEVVTVCAITRQVNGLVVLVVGSSGKYCAVPCGPKWITPAVGRERPHGTER
jgi:hypothetical protein